MGGAVYLLGPEGRALRGPLPSRPPLPITVAGPVAPTSSSSTGDTECDNKDALPSLLQALMAGKMRL